MNIENNRFNLNNPKFNKAKIKDEKKIIGKFNTFCHTITLNYNTIYI